MATIKGIWVFNENPVWEDFGSHNVNFTSNSKTFTSISVGANPDQNDGAALVYANNSETVYVYDFEYTTAWSNEAYKTVDFGSTEQTVDDTFYTWLTANATQQASEETSGVTVEYNSSVVATIPSGNKATIPVADKQMKTDIVITVPKAEGGTDSPLPTEVSTEAEMTALLTSGEVGGVYKYTGTTGTYENGALYLLEAELIYFSVDLNDFTAEKGMTWGEWKESSYNTAEIRWLDSTDGTGMQINLDGTWYFIMNGTEIVGQDETIVNNCLYTTKQETASLITFTIDGTSYQAEEGMTWAEWVESDYNTAGLYVFGDAYIMLDANRTVVDDTGYAVSSSADIIANKAYYLQVGSGD